MNIVAGKYYRTRDGRKVGPMYQKGIDDGMAWRASDSGYWYLNNGKLFETEITDDDLIAEWTDATDDTPTLWRDMTPAEKGALLLAHHEGRAVQRWADGNWHCKIHDGWSNSVAYRIKHEPVVVTINGGNKRQGIWAFSAGSAIMGDTHRITFNMIDGKPDVASIKMEEL